MRFATQIERSIHALEVIQVGVLLSLLPIATLSLHPNTTTLFDEIRTAAILICAAASIALWSVRSTLTKRFSITHHPLVIPILLLGAAFFLSSFMSSKNLVASLTGLPIANISLMLIALLAPSNIPGKLWARFADSVLIIGAVLSITSILQLLGAGPSILINALFGTNLPHTFAFSLAGSPLIALTILIVASITTTIRLWKKSPAEHILLASGCCVLLFGMILHVIQLRPGSQFSPFILPLAANWSIITDIFKSPASAIWGVGPNSFAEAYTIFRPIALNATSAWNVVFQTGSNTVFTLLVTTGALGAFSWVLLTIRSLQLFRHNSAEHRPLGVLVASAVVLQLFVPMNLPLLTLQWIGLTFWIAALQSHHPKVHEISLKFQAHTNNHETPRGNWVLTIVAMAIGAIGSAALLWFMQMTLRADMLFAQSLQAFSTGDGGRAYELQKQVLATNPHIDLYHTTFADTSFAIAQALSKQDNVTDEQRQQITQLIQQSLRSARVATQLNPFSSTNWVMMGTIYSQLIGSVDGAREWAIASYVRSIEAHPNNPILRVQLGSIFYQAEEYQQATQLFQQAYQLKPDLPQASYYLAKTYDKLGDTQQAIATYQHLLSIVNPQDESYMDIEAELTTLIEKAKTPPPQPTQQDAPDPTQADLPEEIARETDILNSAPPQAPVDTLLTEPEASASAEQ